VNPVIPTQIIAICLLFLSGCGFQQYYIVNQPKSAKGRDINYSRIDYPEFSTHIRLLNDIRTLDMVTLVVLPVYIKTKDEQKLAYIRKRPPYDTNKEFRVLLAILPKVENYTLDAKGVSLFINDIDFPAIAIEGPIHYFPYKNFAFSKEMSEATLNKRVDKGVIFSDIEEEGARQDITNGLLDVDLSQIGRWNCFELIFDCPTPSPKQNYKLEIKGLKKNKNTVDMPLIEFEEVKFSDIGSIP
jgi:hypothetical protein